MNLTPTPWGSGAVGGAPGSPLSFVIRAFRNLQLWKIAREIRAALEAALFCVCDAPRPDLGRSPLCKRRRVKQRTPEARRFAFIRLSRGRRSSPARISLAFALSNQRNNQAARPPLGLYWWASLPLFALWHEWQRLCRLSIESISPPLFTGVM